MEPARGAARAATGSVQPPEAFPTKYAVVVLAALVLVLGAQVLVLGEGPAAVQTWECRFVRFDGEGSVGAANAAGKEGWEVVAVRDTVVEGYPPGLYLRRPLR